MLHHVIESENLDPTHILRSMARNTALHANVPFVGISAIKPLIDEAIFQMVNGNDSEALMALTAIMFQQAYDRNDIALADRAFRVWSRLLGMEPHTIMDVLATAMHNEEDA